MQTLNSFLVCLCLLAFHSYSLAVDDDVEKPKAALQSAGAVRIELIAQPREVELPTRFYLALRLVNATAEPVIFRSFDLKPLEEPGGLQISPDCSKKPQVALAANSATTITCQIHSKDFNDSILTFLPSLFGSWSLLTFQPGEYRFVATAEVRVDADTVMAISQTVPIKIRPTVWQICIGAGLGALLLVVFTFSSSRARAALVERERLKNMSSYRLWLGEPFLLWIGATVSASIFIFMTYRLKDVSSPLTITVNDFYGGVAIGLLGVFLADKLAEKFFGVHEQRAENASEKNPAQPGADQ